MRCEAPVFGFGLWLAEAQIAMAFSDHVFNLQSTRLRPNVVHGDKVVRFPSHTRVGEFPAAETFKGGFETVLELGDVIIDILGAADLEETDAVDRALFGLVTVLAQAPGMSGIRLGSREREIVQQLPLYAVLAHCRLLLVQCV